MAAVEVSLSEHMRAYVNGRIASGEYADASDYVRELIRADEKRIQWLRVELQKGLDSGISPLTIDEIIEEAFADIERKCA